MEPPDVTPMSSGKLLKPLALQFSHLWSGDSNGLLIDGPPQGENNLVPVQCSEQSPGFGRCSRWAHIHLPFCNVQVGAASQWPGRGCNVHFQIHSRSSWEGWDLSSGCLPLLFRARGVPLVTRGWEQQLSVHQALGTWPGLWWRFFQSLLSGQIPDSTNKKENQMGWRRTLVITISNI